MNYLVTIGYMTVLCKTLDEATAIMKALENKQEVNYRYANEYKNKVFWLDKPCNVDIEMLHSTCHDNEDLATKALDLINAHPVSPSIPETKL